MRITMVALGTRGDVQPMIALGKGLSASGHDVSMIAGSNFASWVAAHRLHFIPSVDMEALMSSEKGVAWAQRSDSPITQLRMMRDLMNEAGQGMIDPIQAATASTDLLISSFSALSLVQTAGEKSGIPCINALLQPQHPTRSGAACLTPIFPRRESAANRWMGVLSERLIWWVVGAATNRYRAQLGLPRHDAVRSARANRALWALMGFSRLVVPPAPDWPPDAAVTGYWFLDEEEGWTPGAELRAFLAAGPAPVYLGFGSMSNREPEKTLDLILEAVRRSGLRAVVASGWSGGSGASLGPELCVVKSVPHHWLFPRVSAVAHHGGAGTTASGLRAGKPALVVPHMSDQPYWGRRVHELGVGVKPVPRHRLTVESLTSSLAQLTTDRKISDTAAELGERIRAEHGVEAAVVAVEQKEFH